VAATLSTNQKDENLNKGSHLKLVRLIQSRISVEETDVEIQKLAPLCSLN